MAEAEKRAPRKKSAAAEKGPEELLDEMRTTAGIGGIIIRKDGIVLHSTIAVNEVGAGMISSLGNITDALMKKAADSQKELELTFTNLILMIIPLGDYYFCGIVKDREQKKTVRAYAEKSKKYL